MRSLLKSKKAIAPLFIVLMIVLVLIVIYCLLFLPFPAFKKLRVIINFFLIIILWIVIQVGLIYGYYSLGKVATKGLTITKAKMVNYSLRFRHYIIRHN